MDKPEPSIYPRSKLIYTSRQTWKKWNASACSLAEKCHCKRKCRLKKICRCKRKWRCKKKCRCKRKYRCKRKCRCKKKGRCKRKCRCKKKCHCKRRNAAISNVIWIRIQRYQRYRITKKLRFFAASQIQWGLHDIIKIKIRPIR